MGGPGSGRKRSVTPIVRVSWEERRQRLHQIATYAVTHGVRLAMEEFSVGEHLVRRALWVNKLYPARELRAKVGVSAIRILKRMVVDHESAAAAAVAVGVTANYAIAVWREAVAAGFIFQGAADGSGHGVNAAEPDGGERGESPAVG